ncbi:DUF4424 family protein [Acinetobacter ihumii]|uniref:DUF4424 family protein n=1 Tax=Acinetobacter ihumii TaxID=2483802 RepID=UPI00102FE74B|nr:DUF4424 family protein [Acinetobacter ihumii]
MIKKLIVIGLFSILSFSNVHANDSTGYVATGGVEYIKNPNIQMQKENLFISKRQIRVEYEFKNLTSHNIQENIVFPLPKVANSRESDFAHTEALIKSFKVKVNQQPVDVVTHVRAFLLNVNQKGELDWKRDSVDVTQALKTCGLTDQELMNPWTQKLNDEAINQRIYQCQQPMIQKLIKPYHQDEQIYWEAQIIYSWPQVFKANSVTDVQHQYQPLVGGSVYLDDEVAKDHCVDQSFRNALNKMQNKNPPYMGLSYILKTWANWASSIRNFNMLIERDKNELVSLCWKGKIQKINTTQFKVSEKNFKPTQNIDIIFVPILK